MGRTQYRRVHIRRVACLGVSRGVLDPWRDILHDGRFRAVERGCEVFDKLHHFDHSRIRDWDGSGGDEGRKLMKYILPVFFCLMAGLVFLCGVKVLESEDADSAAIVVAIGFLTFGIMLFGATICYLATKR